MHYFATRHIHRWKDWRTDRLADMQAGRKTDSHTDGLTERPAYGRTGGHIGICLRAHTILQTTRNPNFHLGSLKRDRGHRRFKGWRLRHLFLFLECDAPQERRHRLVRRRQVGHRHRLRLRLRFVETTALGAVSADGFTKVRIVTLFLLRHWRWAPILIINTEAWRPILWRILRMVCCSKLRRACVQGLTCWAMHGVSLLSHFLQLFV